MPGREVAIDKNPIPEGPVSEMLFEADATAGAIIPVKPAPMASVSASSSWQTRHLGFVSSDVTKTLGPPSWLPPQLSWQLARNYPSPFNMEKNLPWQCTPIREDDGRSAVVSLSKYLIDQFP